MGTHHPLAFFTGSANRPLAEAVVRILNTPMGKCTTTHLKDSEVHVTIDEAVRDQDVFIIQPCSAPVNDHLMELLLYIDAFRRASAHEITAVIPYYPYGRQERMAKGREAISAKVGCDDARSAGRQPGDLFRRPRTGHAGLLPGARRSALGFARPGALFRKAEFCDAAIVSPDVGRAKFAGTYAERLNLPLVVMHKRREGFDKAEATHVVGDIEGKIPIIIDDVIAGGSVLGEVDGLVEAGARPEIYMAITHGVLLPSAIERLDRDRSHQAAGHLRHDRSTRSRPQASQDHRRLGGRSVGPA